MRYQQFVGHTGFLHIQIVCPGDTRIPVQICKECRHNPFAAIQNRSVQVEIVQRHKEETVAEIPYSQSSQLDHIQNLGEFFIVTVDKSHCVVLYAATCSIFVRQKIDCQLAYRSRCNGIH